MLPRISESLAGRMEILTLQPLSQREIENGGGRNIVDLFLEGGLPRDVSSISRHELADRIVKGGYPEPLLRKSSDDRAAWHASYITAIMQKDIRDMANIEGLDVLPRLLRLLATRNGALLNKQDLANDTGLPHPSLSRYLTLLEAAFLLQRVPAWFSNYGKRLIKSPKTYLGDTGLSAWLPGVDETSLLEKPDLLGRLLESFVFLEITKQGACSATKPATYHYRELRGREVDIVLEIRDGRILRIEVKATHNPDR